MSREFTDWVRTLDELEPKGVQQETRLAPKSQSPCPCCQHYKTCDVPTSSCGLMRMHDKRDPMPPSLAINPPVSRFSFSLAVVWLAGFYLMAAVCVGLVVYDLWLVFVS